MKDPLQPDLNRAQQLKTDDKYQKIGIHFLDIDNAIYSYMTSVIMPSLVILDNQIKVPIIYGNAERWKSVQQDGYYLDSKGQIQIPLMMFKRSSVQPQDSMKNMANRHESYPTHTTYSAKHKYDKFSLMQGIKRPVEQYNITIPDYVDITYEALVWTDYTEHMNSIIEAFQFASNSYWGDKNGFKFMTSVDSFDMTSDVADGAQRLIRTSFNMNVKAYMLPEKFNNKPTTEKALTIKKVIWGSTKLS